MDHIGYNIDGAPITRSAAKDAIDSFLASQTKEGRRTIYDPDNDRNVVLSKDDIAMLRRVRDGAFADAAFDETADHFNVDVPREIHPLGNPTYPKKSRFAPSAHEAQIVQRLVVALRNGWIRPRAEEAAKKDAPPPVYLLWGGDQPEHVDTRHRYMTRYSPPAVVLPLLLLTLLLPGRRRTCRPRNRLCPATRCRSTRLPSTCPTRTSSPPGR